MNVNNGPGGYKGPIKKIQPIQGIQNHLQKPVLAMQVKHGRQNAERHIARSALNDMNSLSANVIKTGNRVVGSTTQMARSAGRGVAIGLAAAGPMLGALGRNPFFRRPWVLQPASPSLAARCME